MMKKKKRNNQKEKNVMKVRRNQSTNCLSCCCRWWRRWRRTNWNSRTWRRIRLCSISPPVRQSLVLITSKNNIFWSDLWYVYFDKNMTLLLHAKDRSQIVNHLTNAHVCLFSFAHSSILSSYIGALQTYANNSPYLNHCIIRMFHRVTIECDSPAMLFQLSLFRILQKFHLDPLGKSKQFIVGFIYHWSIGLFLPEEFHRKSFNSALGYYENFFLRLKRIRISMRRFSSGKIVVLSMKCSKDIGK